MTEPADRFRPETLVAIEAAKAALTIARRGVGAEAITAKGGRDLVTAADVVVEDAVRRLLGDASSVSVIGEERGGEASADGSPYWLVDPICGTRNFASGIPLYCVNVALVEGDEVVIGVVGNPATGEIDVAERGRGAWRWEDGTRHRLVTSDDTRIVVIEDGKSKDTRRESAARFAAAVIRADRWDFRSLGTTLASPYVAAGRIAAYVVFWVSAIHTAGGSLLISEAGGTVSDIDGRPWTIDSDSLVGSANRHLHEELLRLLRAPP